MEKAANVGAFLFVFLVCGIVSTVMVLHYYKRKQVKTFSTRLKQVNAINKQYTFHNDIKSLSYQVSTNTKRQYDRFDYTGYLQSLVRDNKNYFSSLVDKTEDNKRLQAEYLGKMQAISRDSIKTDAKKCGLNPKTYIKYEDGLIRNAMKYPACSFTVTCNLSYSSPKGQSQYRSNKVFSYEEIKQALETSDTIRVTKESIAYERAMLTDSERYDIMKRDGFKCQLCGRTAADGVKLHVDHIIPVSKGGKSVPSNLRTLCEQCNLGKSNKYDPNGLN